LYPLNTQKSHSEIIHLLETRILASAKEWYSSIGSTEISLNYLSKRHFRWSTHLIYAIEDKKNQVIDRILVKIIHERSVGERNQDVSVRPSKSLAFEYNALSHIYHQFRKVSIDGIIAVRPLAYYQDLNALVLEYLPGKHMLSTLLQAGLPWAKNACLQASIDFAFKCGQLLNILHHCPNADYTKKEILDATKFTHELKKKISKLFVLDSSPLVKKNVTTILHLVEKRLLGSHYVTKSLLHNDFYPENIVQLPNGQVYTIDTTLHQVGAIERDIAKFLVGIETTKCQLLFGALKMRSTVPHNVNQAFLKGYHSLEHNEHKALSIFLFLALLQRWIEVLEVTKNSTSPAKGRLLTRIRITPFMLKRMKLLEENIEKEISLKT